MTKVLDLRKKSNPAPKQAINPPPKKEAVRQAPPQTVQPAQAKQSPPEISWEAPSFYYNPQKRYFSLLVVALALGGGGMLFFQRDTLTAIFMLLSSLVLVLYSNKRPEISKITIDQIGVTVSDNAYYYKDLKSFWIHYNPGDLKELSLESKKWYMPHIKVSIENKNPLVIRSLLVNFLPEREHEHSLVDIISRKIGL